MTTTSLLRTWYEKGAKSSLYRALPVITSNRHHIGSPQCQQISSWLYLPFRYSGPRYIRPPSVSTYDSSVAARDNDGVRGQHTLIIIDVYHRNRVILLLLILLPLPHLQLLLLLLLLLLLILLLLLLLLSLIHI